jgi:hypothetical protein
MGADLPAQYRIHFHIFSCSLCVAINLFLFLSLSLSLFLFSFRAFGPVLPAVASSEAHQALDSDTAAAAKCLAEFIRSTPEQSIPTHDFGHFCKIHGDHAETIRRRGKGLRKFVEALPDQFLIMEGGNSGSFRIAAVSPAREVR